MSSSFHSNVTGNCLGTSEVRLIALSHRSQSVEQALKLLSHCSAIFYIETMCCHVVSTQITNDSCNRNDCKKTKLNCICRANDHDILRKPQSLYLLTVVDNRILCSQIVPRKSLKRRLENAVPFHASLIPVLFGPPNVYQRLPVVYDVVVVSQQCTQYYIL